jgi:hypothetical protein
MCKTGEQVMGDRPPQTCSCLNNCIPPAENNMLHHVAAKEDENCFTVVAWSIKWMNK